MFKIPTSIAMGISLFLLVAVIGGILIWQYLNFGIDKIILKISLIILLFGAIFISALFIIQIIINKFQEKKFKHDYAIIIKCKKCGAEFHKTDCPSCCPKCNEFLRPELAYIIMGATLIIIALWVSFFLLANLQQSQNLHLAFPMMGLFVLGGINLILYGTGHGVKNKFYRFTFGLLFFLFGLYCIFAFLSSADVSLPTILICSVFTIIGFGIMSGKMKLMTEDQMAESLPEKGVGGLFKKLFEFKNRKKY